MITHDNASSPLEPEASVDHLGLTKKLAYFKVKFAWLLLTALNPLLLGCSYLHFPAPKPSGARLPSLIHSCLRVLRSLALRVLSYRALG